MSHRGGRGRGSEGKQTRGGRGGGYDGGKGNPSSIVSPTNAPPPSIDESPVRNTTTHSNIAMTSGANSATARSNKGGRGSNANSPTTSSPPAPVGPSSSTATPNSTHTAPLGKVSHNVHPLSSEAIAKPQTSNTAPRNSVSDKLDVGQPREISVGYERPPAAPQRSSFEVTASPVSSNNHINSVSSNSGLLGGEVAGRSAPFTPTSASVPQPPNLGLSSAPVDRDVFVAARAAVHNAPRPVLAAILTSILDDYPALAPLVKFRYERAISAVATQQMIAQQQIPPTGFWNGAAGTSSGSNSPCRKRSFRGRGGHEEEQQVCGVHGAVRSTKHLRLTENGLFECIPGFHCLETSKDNSNCVSPVKGERDSSLHINGIVPFVPHRSSFSSPPSPPPGFDHYSAAQAAPYHTHSFHGHGQSNTTSLMGGKAMPTSSVVGLARQNTQPPPNITEGTFSGNAPDDDNLEELLKSLHLASSNAL